MTLEFTSLVHPTLTKRAHSRWPGAEVWYFFCRATGAWGSFVLRRHGQRDVRLGGSYRAASSALAALGRDH